MDWTSNLYASGQSIRPEISGTAYITGLFGLPYHESSNCGNFCLFKRRSSTTWSCAWSNKEHFWWRVRTNMERNLRHVAWASIGVMIIGRQKNSALMQPRGNERWICGLEGRINHDTWWQLYPFATEESPVVEFRSILPPAHSQMPGEQDLPLTLRE
jgi:hypothetical protein